MLLEGVFVDQLAGQVLAKNDIIGDGGIFLLFAAGSSQGCYSDDCKDNV